MFAYLSGGHRIGASSRQATDGAVVGGFLTIRAP